MCRRTNLLEFFVAALFAIEKVFNNLPPTSRGLVELRCMHPNLCIIHLHAVIWKESQDVMLIFKNQGAE